MDLTKVTPVSDHKLSTIVLAYYHSIDQREVEKALSVFAPDAVYRRPGYDAFVGLEAISRYYRNDRVITSGRHVIETIIAHVDQVVVRGGFLGMSRAGQRIDVRFADFWRFFDLIVVERNTYFDAPIV